MASRASTTSRAVGMVRVQQHEEHNSPLRLQPEHPLLTKEGETAVEGHHHPTEHVLQHPTELHNHLQLNIEREEKKTKPEILENKNPAQSCPPNLPTPPLQACTPGPLCMFQESFKGISRKFERVFQASFKVISCYKYSLISRQ